MGPVKVKVWHQNSACTIQYNIDNRVFGFPPSLIFGVPLAKFDRTGLQLLDFRQHEEFPVPCYARYGRRVLWRSWACMFRVSTDERERLHSVLPGWWYVYSRFDRLICCASDQKNSARMTTSPSIFCTPAACQKYVLVYRNDGLHSNSLKGTTQESIWRLIFKRENTIPKVRNYRREYATLYTVWGIV